MERPHLFCVPCLSFFELLAKEKYCPYCFTEVEKRGCCALCLQKGNFSIKVAAVFDKIEAVSTFCHRVEANDLSDLVKTAASFYLLQLEALQWHPDLVIACPQTVWRRLVRGGDVRQEIAKSLSRMLKIKRMQWWHWFFPNFTSKRLLFIGLYISDLQYYRDAIESINCKSACFLALARDI